MFCGEHIITIFSGTNSGTMDNYEACVTILSKRLRTKRCVLGITVRPWDWLLTVVLIGQETPTTDTVLQVTVKA